MEDKQTLTTQEIVDRLSEINKDELNERQFFQEVLSVIKDMKDFDLTEESFAEISKTLREIGCVDYKTWLEEKSKVEAKLRLPSVENGSRDGSLAVGARLIDSCMTDYEHSKARLNMITQDGETPAFLPMWLKNNEKILKGQKENPDITFEYQEFVEKEERELEDRKARKSQLTLEIKEIKEQVDKLEIEESTLRNSKIRKEIELKGLEEK